jgi:uncharacterized membrane-anchored protein YhcB (DUF1043 family)
MEDDMTPQDWILIVCAVFVGAVLGVLVVGLVNMRKGERA